MKTNEKIVEQAMIAEVMTWVDDSEPCVRFKRCSKSDLIGYHSTLGRHIRNHFNLWANKHQPQIENGVDVSQDHPHEISMRVIKGVWENFQNE